MPRPPAGCLGACPRRRRGGRRGPLRGRNSRRGPDCFWCWVYIGVSFCCCVSRSIGHWKYGKEGARRERRRRRRRKRRQRSSISAEAEDAEKKKKRGRGRREVDDEIDRSHGLFPSFFLSPLLFSLSLPLLLSLAGSWHVQGRTLMFTCGGTGASGSMPSAREGNKKNARKRKHKRR